jgi:hypothetical protein
MSSPALYDRIGGSYTTTRREDPRIARPIRAGLGDARRWEQRNAELLDPLAEIDLGYRLIVAKLESSSATRR